MGLSRDSHSNEMLSWKKGSMRFIETKKPMLGEDGSSTVPICNYAISTTAIHIGYMKVNLRSC